MLSLLLDYGCHVNIQDNESRTPLWLAAKNNFPETCDVLLQKKANPCLANKEGKKPIDVTTDSSIKKLLTEYSDVKLINSQFLFLFLWILSKLIIYKIYRNTAT